MANKSDVVIIGGGAIGVCTAHYLARHGIKSTILERHKIGSGCSDKNAGLVVPSHIMPLAAPGAIAKGLRWMLKPDSPYYIKPRFDLELLSWIWHFSRACRPDRAHNSMPVLNELLQASAGLFDELAGAHNRFGLVRRGLLLLYKSEKALQADLHEADAARALGQEVHVLKDGDLEALQPGIKMNVAGGIHYTGDAHLDPTSFVAVVRERLDAGLVNIVENVEVVGFEKSGSQIQAIRTSAGRFEAREFVLAAGVWSSGLAASLALKLPLQAGKGYSVTIQNPIRQLAVPCLLAEASVAVTPLAGSLRFAGTMELGGRDLSLNRRRIDTILRAVPAYFPEMDTSNLNGAESWAGLRPCTPDGLPYIGRFSRVTNLVAATGHAMLGISLAPITGKLVSEIITHQNPSVRPGPFSPERYK